MNRAAAQLRRTFSALKVPNFRRFFYGQSISLVGTWMQSVAQSWLVYSLTHSSTALGGVVAVQTLPVLLLGPYAGVIADRTDKRRLMVVLQGLMGIQALVLGLLAILHVVTFWQVCVLALALGLNNTFENPARQSFVLEMVGGENVRNAVSLNSTMVNAARAVGPAVAGIIIVAAGVGVCFLLNALSFVAVVYSLVSMDKSSLQPSVPVARGKGQLREGLKYVKHEPRIGIPLLMMGLVGTLAYEFQVSLPVLAKETFHGGAETYGFLTAFMGAGAVMGGLVTATRGKTGLRPLSIAAIVFGVAILATSVSPVLALAYGTMALVGWGSVAFLATGNSTLQLGSDPTMRGRVMALWAVAFLGSTPIGGPLIGWVIAQTNARVGLAVGGVSCLLAACLGLVARARLKSRRDKVGGPTELPEVPIAEVEPVPEAEELPGGATGTPVPVGKGGAATAPVGPETAGPRLRLQGSP
ncbi:MAG TPA: MFS transporter [Acidimicrobiales bacterium]|nr:MFS transporter [Acidimicrobiales bacterium]